MTLIGFWHGANWTFIVFGLYWGIVIAFYLYGAERVAESNALEVAAHFGSISRHEPDSFGGGHVYRRVHWLGVLPGSVDGGCMARIKPRLFWHWRVHGPACRRGTRVVSVDADRRLFGSRSGSIGIAHGCLQESTAGRSAASPGALR